jgi:hypothetical protein
MEQGTWETDTAADPMITTSVRLAEPLLDWVRHRAAASASPPRWSHVSRARTRLE